MDSSDIAALKEEEVKVINTEGLSNNEGGLESSGNEELIADRVEDENAQVETIEKAETEEHQEELTNDESKETDMTASEAPSKKQKIEGSEESTGLSQEIVG